MQNSFRLLQLSASLSGGGAERQLSHLCRELAKRGHAVTVAFLTAGPDGRWINETPVRGERLRARSNYSPRLVPQVVRLVRRLSPCVVQSWGFQVDVLAGLAHILLPFPWLIRERSSGESYPPWSWKTLLRNTVARRASGIVSNSAGGDSYWRVHFAGDRRIIGNGYPVQAIVASATAGRMRSRDSDVPTILCACRMEPGKRVDRLIDAFSVMSRKVAARLVLCGEGTSRDSLVRKVSELGLRENVVFAGHLETEALWAQMGRASCFVSLSAFEGAPNAPAEAGVAGCRLVLSDIEAHRSLAEVFPAALVAAGDLSAIATALSQALSAQRPPIPGSRSVAELSVERMADAYERAYEDARVHYASQ